MKDLPPILLYNSLSKKKEAFQPIKSGLVTMYNCGPTVYDYPHIGNLRPYVFADLLRRLFEWRGLKVKQVINITDVGHLSGDTDSGEDKMMKALTRENKPKTKEAMKALGDFYTEAFTKDLESLNIKKPDYLPKASDHIAPDIDLIKKLEEKGFAYKTQDGVYFDTAKDTSYGKLGGIGSDDNDLKARVALKASKRHPRDFALWKFSDSPESGWESPWGVGFPGWHIECSAMSMKYLGETFDIHTGGIDHIPVHHNNEIAQSENATGKPLARFWLHSEFLNQPGGKMAKSEGDTLTLADLEKRGISASGYRYFLMTAHYRTPITLSIEAISGAETAFSKLKNNLESMEDVGGKILPSYLEQFEKYIGDDLNTPKAIGLVWDLIKDLSVSKADKYVSILHFNRFLGLKLETEDAPVWPETIKTLADQRNIARKNENWEKADSLRSEIESLGYTVKDSSNGQIIKKKIR